MLHVWNIYQHWPSKSPSLVVKYTSTMEPMAYEPIQKKKAHHPTYGKPMEDIWKIYPRSSMVLVYLPT